MTVRARPSLLESLENRLLCARTPVDPTPASIGRTFDIGERIELFGQLTNLPARTYKRLQADLRANDKGKFDSDLLSYMRTRTGVNYFFDDSQAAGIASYVKNNLSTTTQLDHANDVTDRRLFPNQSSVTNYTVQLPNAIDWNDATKNSNPEYLTTLNRQDWWVDLAQSYRYTGNEKYLTELKYELASWSQQNPTFTLPRNDASYTAYGFNVGIRVDSWVMAYFSALSSSAWDGASNSLMLYKLGQQGDVLNTVAASTTDFTSNRSITVGKATQLLGEVFPEFTNAAKWEKNGRNTVFASMAAQFYADGSHREQSPGYALNVLDDVLEIRQLDKINGIDWSTPQLAMVTNAVDALWQQLSPNGKRPGIGDTYRLTGNGQFTKAALTLGVDRWPENQANARDAYIFGTAAVTPYENAPGDSLGDRGDTYALSDSGNYVMRSDNSADARQINFTAGPKGGVHGHYDYMGFELSGYGRPLIADPGPYIYDTSAARDWVTSAAAHNTISVANTNPADLENNNDILVSGFSQVAGGTMISASYNGYGFLDSNPTLSRSIWYDGNNTMVIVDFASASSATTFQTGFTLEGQNTSRSLENGTIYTRNDSGNVRIQSVLAPGQEAHIRTKGVFTSDLPSQLTNPATRYYTDATGTYAVFATVITTYNGSAANATNNVTWQRMPTKAGQSAILNVNGQSITFSGPQFAQVGKNGKTRGTYNDIAYDSKGRLHMVFYDQDTHNLKYAVRSAKGVWGNIQTIDGQQNVGVTPSLAIDSDGLPHVAYQDAANGDLRYAYLSGDTHSWVVQVVDAKGSTGAYPSLALSRSGGAVIAYYNKTKGDLRVASSSSDGFAITTVDSKGDVGRFASLQLDPNRPTASKLAIAYEDATTGDLKYAIQSGSGYNIEVADGTRVAGGGYVSMKFYDAGGTFEPVATYYDGDKGRLKYAVRSGGVWSNTVISKSKRQGLYSKLAVVGNKPRVFFYDAANNAAMYLTGNKISGGTWKQTQIAGGGRDIHYALYGDRTAFTTIDDIPGYLTVGTL